MKKALSKLGFVTLTPLFLFLAFIILCTLVIFSRSGGVFGGILQLIFIDYWDPISLYGVNPMHLLIASFSAYKITEVMGAVLKVSRQFMNITLFLLSIFLLYDIIWNNYLIDGKEEIVKTFKFYGTLKICFLMGIIGQILENKKYND